MKSNDYCIKKSVIKDISCSTGLTPYKFKEDYKVSSWICWNHYKYLDDLVNENRWKWAKKHDCIMSLLANKVGFSILYPCNHYVGSFCKFINEKSKFIKLVTDLNHFVKETLKEDISWWCNRTNLCLNLGSHVDWSDGNIIKFTPKSRIKTVIDQVLNNKDNNTKFELLFNRINDFIKIVGECYE